MKKVLWVLLSVLLISSMIPMGCSTTTTQSTPPSTSAPLAPATIKIGVLTSITGPDSTTGIPSQFAFQQAIDDINKDGGVFVKEYNKKIPLEMDFKDTQTDPDKTMAAAEQINADGCPITVGTTLAGIAAGTFEKNKLPFVVSQFTVNGMSQQGFKYFFNIDKLNSGLSAAIFQLVGSLPQSEVPTKWALLEEQADWVMELAGYLKKDAAQHGITFSYEGGYQQLAPDMSQLILGAKNSGAEVLIAAPTTPDAITMLKQMQQLDYHPKAIIFFRATDDPSWGGLGALGNDVIGSPQWVVGLNYKDTEVQALVSAWSAKSGTTGGHPSLGPCYASIQIVAAAIEKAGSLDRDAIRDALVATDMDTVIGHVSFDASGVRVDPPLGVEQWQNGVMQLVWPNGPDYDSKPVIWPIPQQ